INALPCGNQGWTVIGISVPVTSFIRDCTTVPAFTLLIASLLMNTRYALTLEELRIALDNCRRSKPFIQTTSGSPFTASYRLPNADWNSTPGLVVLKAAFRRVT